MTTKTSTAEFDPNSLASGDGIFGLPFTTDEATQVILPVPWEATVSYREGTSKAPEALLAASKQVDLFDPNIKDAWKLGLAMDEIPQAIVALNAATRKKVSHFLELLESGQTDDALLADINAQSEKVNDWVRTRARHFLDQGKLVYSIGGDHSTPLGLIQELAQGEEFGILHIDAHADLRDAYEGFEHSHASIMFNVLKLPKVTKLVQIGIRDYCEDEINIIEKSNGRAVLYTDQELKAKEFEGESWKKICEDIISHLPQRVYVSFDVDGLDPKLCPNTGTPVPGGLEFEQTLYLIKEVVRSKRTLIGFDISEVTPGEDEWDANVGARLLFRIANLTALSNGLKPLSNY